MSSGTTNMVWDANLYLKFADHRVRPALDLMGRLDPANGARPGHAIYDLGCGAGNISRILAERFPTAEIVGIDSSEEMLAKARSRSVTTCPCGRCGSGTSAYSNRPASAEAIATP